MFYDLKYLEGNPHISSVLPFNETWKKLELGEEDDFDSSDGSYNSNDEEFDTDYEYDFDKGFPNQLTPIPTEVNLEWSMEFIRMGTIKDDFDDFSSDLQSTIRDLEYYVANQIDLGDSFSIFYFSQVMGKIEKLKIDLDTKKITIHLAHCILKILESSNAVYVNEIKIYYAEVLNKEPADLLITQQENLTKMNESKEQANDNSDGLNELYDKDEEWKDDKFDNFVMKTSWKDQFEKDSQVFFCYGRLSNRLMLLRYGMALEWNKYEHVHFKISYMNEFKDNYFVLKKIKYFRLNKWKTFKLRRTSFNVDLLNYCKANFWILGEHSIDSLLKPVNSEFELIGLSKAQEFLEQFLKGFTNSMEEHENQLKNPNVTYHEYFAIVYKLERQRVVAFHLQAIKVLIEIIRRLKKGITPEFSFLRVHDLETVEEYNRNRIFFQKYSERVVKYYKKYAV